MPEPVICVDVGSTFTKAVLVDVAGGEVLGTAQHPTTLPDVMVGVAAVRDALAQARERERERRSSGDGSHRVTSSGAEHVVGVSAVLDAEILACSSAGGGLRLAVIGHERLVTAEAGQRVALSAGGRVVHLGSGRLTPADTQALRDARPDLIVLTGGTDGGNEDVVVHNARRIGIARLAAPVVLACNQQAAGSAADELLRRGRPVTVTGNVLPEIGVLRPGPAREAIRAAFLEHVIGGKSLSRSSSRINGKTFRQLVRAATPDAVLTGAEILATDRDVLMIDVGGATTDVYSVLAPTRDAQDRPPGQRRAAGDWMSARTVEGDLGVRWSAAGVVEAGVREGLLDAAGAAVLGEYAQAVQSLPKDGGIPDRRAPGHSPDPDPASVPAHDLWIARLAVLIAVRRHGRPSSVGGDPRPLRDVALVVGGGGVLRHAPQARGAAVLESLLTDHAGGWAVPGHALRTVDRRYTLFAAGLLAGRADPGALTRLACAGLEPVTSGPG